MKQLFITVFLTVLFLGLAGAADAQGGRKTAAAPVDAPICASLPTGGAPLICQCPAGAPGGSVWGSGPYTADSNICAAARHSGVVPEQGGVLQLVRRPGQSSYEGSTRNGVTTGSWGAYGESFSVLAVGASIAASGPAACGTMPDGTEALECSCTAARTSGSVWGSGPYTADSDICTAATHAGAIGVAGGTVKVLRIGGLESYTGSVANGVRSSDWGAYGSSIVVNRN